MVFFSEGIEYMRIIRDPTPNQYMVLIKFKTQRLADEFFNTYNNVPFNSIEPDICQLIYVARVEVIKDSEVCIMYSRQWARAFLKIRTCHKASFMN